MCCSAMDTGTAGPTPPAEVGHRFGGGTESLPSPVPFQGRAEISDTEESLLSSEFQEAGFVGKDFLWHPTASEGGSWLRR